MKKFALFYGIWIFVIFFASALQAAFTQEQIDEKVNAKAKGIFDLINENWVYPSGTKSQLLEARSLVILCRKS